MHGHQREPDRSERIVDSENHNEHEQQASETAAAATAAFILLNLPRLNARKMMSREPTVNTPYAMRSARCGRRSPGQYADDDRADD
jgi:hypothetical protein